ncbi:hypothetical protein RFI_13672 [Reticulomyxa filosa]|uniref:EF-hand domain-containing protein n=1 Tax=Reticulomyxa filosa TaxID=46433 RepID=X6NB44_RETFI|nr:hypothetical protein RFI_13672 [Reticulomyxa filosa]|eukprot:ETO23505.1 hypothetical protein RFI_13672 [Reticulomyxa filosa]
MTDAEVFDFFNSNTLKKKFENTVTAKNKPPNQATPTKEVVIRTMKEYDGSGIGLLTSKQCLAAMRDIPNLELTDEERKELVEVGQEMCSDKDGRIKLEEFASHVAFEIRKKQNRKSKVQATPVMQQRSNENPFLDTPTGGQLVIQTNDSPSLSPMLSVFQFVGCIISFIHMFVLPKDNTP